MTPTAIAWSGVVVSIQPRIRLLRSFDERSHTYLGYVLRLAGSVDGEPRSFGIAIGEAAHAKHRIEVGNALSGMGVPVPDQRRETAELYRISRLKVLNRADRAGAPPPWHGVPPVLDVYRERGCRRLAARTYSASCTSCMWGCRMPVEIIVDHWNPGRKRYREETFCYGPLSCRIYKAGPTRKVPGRQGTTWEEQDWVDQDTVSHRDPDD